MQQVQPKNETFFNVTMYINVFIVRPPCMVQPKNETFFNVTMYINVFIVRPPCAKKGKKPAPAPPAKGVCGVFLSLVDTRCHGGEAGAG